MIKSIKAENYKSIKSLELELGRVNVFIGENGAGKSNILEVFALAGAAVANKLDNEFLVSRGIRVTEPELMRPAFAGVDSLESMLIFLANECDISFFIRLDSDNSPYSRWNMAISKGLIPNFDDLLLGYSLGYFSGFKKVLKEANLVEKKFIIEKIISGLDEKEKNGIMSSMDIHLKKNIDIMSLFYEIDDFIVYSPEYSALRDFHREGQIEPLGTKGEGLLKLLSVLSREEYGETLQEIKESLKALCWFEDFKLIEGDTFAPRRIAIKDRYIEDTGRYFDQMSANEGFLFLLFYFALFSTSLTPSIFAIDNIDASLNPALCEKLLRELVKLAKKHDKQVLLTTHNPAVLDGLNLDDDEQRLFVVSRNYEGETIVTRRTKRKTTENERPVRLSEMFLRGSLGGLPKGF